MKKIYTILVLLSFITSSCEDYLNTKPIDKIGLEQYYTDEAGLTSVLYGVYDPLGSGSIYGNTLWKTLEVCTDEAYYAFSATTTGTQVYVYDASNADVSNLWTALYVGIERANDLIANINVPKMDETIRQQILGEALFLRGYYYFLLVSRFGDVPIRLTPTTSPNGVKMAKSPAADVYAQVLRDMKDAEGKVRQAKWDNSARISKTVVQGILARVYLQMAGYPLMDVAKYADALAYSKKVIDSGERDLNVSYNTDPFFNSFNETVPSIPANSNNAYRQIFIDAGQETNDTKEIIWEIEFKGNQTDGYSERGGLGAQNGIAFSNTVYTPTVGYCYGFHKCTGRLFNKYDASGLDLRRDWNLANYSLVVTNGAVVRSANTSKTQPYGRDCAKWKREYEKIIPKAKNDSEIDFPLLRYADVLLMYAEADNQVNGSPSSLAIECVNKVRRRAYGRTNVSLPYPTSDAATAAAATSKASFQLFIEDERMRELCFEDVRKMDLIRWNKFISTMKSVSNEIRTQTLSPSQQYGALGGESVGTKHLLFPIPSVETTSNPLITENNPGW